MKSPPTGRHRGDQLYSGVLTLAGGLVFVLAGAVVAVAARIASPTLSGGVWRFLSGRVWDPVHQIFGALPFVYGTVVTSIIAAVVAAPVALGVALFVVEIAGPRSRTLIGFFIELLAAIPSVVYGLWGLVVLVPLLRQWIEPALSSTLGFLPLFRGPPLGLGYLAAGLLLAVMILPTITTVSIEVLRAVPSSLSEGALALGATRWEAIRMAILPFARRGLFGAVLLGLARAIGETMAVTMVIGNQASLGASLFQPGYTLPAVLANEFTEAAGPHLAALASLALVLLGVALSMSALARILLRLTGRRTESPDASAA